MVSRVRTRNRLACASSGQRGPSGPAKPPTGPKGPSSLGDRFTTQKPKLLSTILDLGVSPSSLINSLGKTPIFTTSQPGVKGAFIREPFLEVYHDLIDYLPPLPGGTDMMPWLSSLNNDGLTWSPEVIELTSSDPKRKDTKQTIMKTSASQFHLVVDVGVEKPYHAYINLIPCIGEKGHGWIAIYEADSEKPLKLRDTTPGLFSFFFSPKDLIVFRYPDPKVKDGNLHAFKIDYWTPTERLIDTNTPTEELEEGGE